MNNFKGKYPLDELVLKNEEATNQRNKMITGGISWIRSTYDIQEIVKYLRQNSNLGIKQIEIMAIEKQDVNVIEKIIQAKEIIRKENIKNMIKAFNLEEQDQFLSTLSLEEKIELKLAFEEKAIKCKTTNTEFSQRVIEVEIFAVLKDNLSQMGEKEGREEI